MEELKKIIIDLLLENNKLKNELLKSEDSSSYWYKKFVELENKKENE